MLGDIDTPRKWTSPLSNAAECDIDPYAKEQAPNSSNRWVTATRGIYAQPRSDIISTVGCCTLRIRCVSDKTNKQHFLHHCHSDSRHTGWHGHWPTPGDWQTHHSHHPGHQRNSLSVSTPVHSPGAGKRGLHLQHNEHRMRSHCSRCLMHNNNNNNNN